MTITIITATYNRRELLKQLFRSLLAQHFDAIEWIIVDDGGTDGTAETVKELQNQARFSIRYFRQANSGKHFAVNAGLDVATGDLVCVVDDDDYFLPGVFAAIAADFESIKDDEAVGGLSYLTVDPAGKVWGSEFPQNRMISDHFECRINRRVWGDKIEFTKAKVLADHHIRYCQTETKGGFGGETVFFFRIAERFKTYYVNLPVLVKDYQEDGLSVNWRRKSLENPELTAQYYAGHLDRRIRMSIRLRYMVAYVAIMRYAGKRIDSNQIGGGWNWFLLLLAYLPGAIIGAKWKSYKDGLHPQSKKWLRTTS